MYQSDSPLPPLSERTIICCTAQILSILEPHGKAEASEDSSGDEAETSPDKNGSLNSDKEDKEARKERKRLKRESKEKRREERRKKKLLKNQEVLFKMVEGLLIKPPQ